MLIFCFRTWTADAADTEVELEEKVTIPVEDLTILDVIITYILLSLYAVLLSCYRVMRPKLIF